MLLASAMDCYYGHIADDERMLPRIRQVKARRASIINTLSTIIRCYGLVTLSLFAVGCRWLAASCHYRPRLITVHRDVKVMLNELTLLSVNMPYYITGFTSILATHC